MTPSTSGPAGSNGDGVVTGLAGELEAQRRTTDTLHRDLDGLRRDVETLGQLPGRVAELATLITRLADTTTQSPGNDGGGEGELVGSWLDLSTSPETAHKLLADLAGWMGRVYLRYADAARSLPECWAWHPDVVEELLWLQQAWTAAYRTPEVGVGPAAEWHERHRPGVVARIKAIAGTCSAENHTGHRICPAPVVPLASAVEQVAGWWGTDRDAPAPEPDPGLLAGHREQARTRGRR